MSFFSSNILWRLLTERKTSFSVLAPVHTNLPEVKIKMTVLGSSILWIKPGNCSGSYILLDNLRAASSNWTRPPRLIDATMFWTVTVASFFILIPPFLNFWTTVFTAVLRTCNWSTRCRTWWTTNCTCYTWWWQWW